MKELELKISKIDPYKCSIEELKEEIQRLKSLKEEYYNLEQSIKIFINSIYGGVGSPFFEQYNVSIAEAVTAQGQDMIKFANDILDEYFIKYWENDKELHEKLGLTYVNSIKTKTIVIYNDTDSTYITLDPIVKSCSIKDESPEKIREFILKLKDYRLDDYIKNKFDEYGKKFNTNNIQELELEKISYAGLMIAKKKYVLDLAWKDPGVEFEKHEKITPTGVEIVQGSTPPFSRKVLKDLVKYLFVHGASTKYSNLIGKLREYKKEFIVQEPSDISKTVSIGDYEKYVLEDKKEILLAGKCPLNVRSASVYNNILLNSQWRSKYKLINTGDKLKFYYAKNEMGAFGFLPSNFPYEFAAEVDYDKQFEKVVIDPFNKFMIAAGFNPAPGTLDIAKQLF